MNHPIRNRAAVGPIVFFTLCLLLGGYFAFAAIQGNYGVLRRAEVQAHAEELAHDLALLEAEVATMENLTKRLSDDYLDLDLLDQQARDVLGLMRPDEIVVR